MGYFSNGTEGWDYYEQYCSRCLHDKDESCPVWNAHLLHNYDECNNEGSILHMLIPRFGHYGRGKGSKAPDRWALPLSAIEHARQHSGSEESYWRSAGINPHILALTIFGLWSDLGDDAEPFAVAIINQSRSGRSGQADT